MWCQKLMITGRQAPLADKLYPSTFSFLPLGQVIPAGDVPSSTSCLLSAEEFVSPLVFGRRFFTRFLTSGWTWIRKLS